MPSTPRLVLGTGNRKKAAELVALLTPAGWTVETLADYPAGPAVEETGDSFSANALLKAMAQAGRLNRWVLGEDSGLAVDALGGAPGILSARFAGPEATDDDNNLHLLAALEGVPTARRGAHYVCSMVVVDPQGTVHARSEAICRGRIRSAPSGTGGFGYDPLFEILEYHRTFGELGPSVKAILSHRARAAAEILPQLMQLSEADSAEVQ